MATEALSEATWPFIGIAVTASQASFTTRDRPLPSDPTTITTGNV